nr:copper resistance protein B [Marinobacter salicampi]
MLRLPLAVACFSLALASPATTWAAPSDGGHNAHRHTVNSFWGVSLEEFEYRYSDSDDEVAVWDGDAFFGSDELKFRWIFSGEWEEAHDAFESLENQFVVQTPISDFFDAKAGVRIDTPEGPDRVYGVLGINGLAPYWFEVDSNLYVSDEGDASIDLDAEYELLLTNRLILSASLDVLVALSSDREIGLGKGLSSTETGLRLGYDLIDRSFSPYLGIVHERKYGDTADIARTSGGSKEDWFAVVGARLMF